MKKSTFAKLALVPVLASLLVACSSGLNSDNTTDPTFTNTALHSANADAKVYNGYSQNDLQAAYSNVYFAFDQYQPLPEYVAVIQAQADFIKATNAKVLLEGYTDERGTPEYNVSLGAERARAVANLLINAGVPAENIRQLSYGEERPAVLGHTEADHAKNRRVVFNYRF